MRLFALASVLSACLVSTAGAQKADPWLLVGTTSTVGDAWMEPTASRLRTELLQRGVEVWSLSSAAQRFEKVGSAPAAVVAGAKVEAWAEQSRAGLWHLAMGDPEAALVELNQTQELSRRVIEELNRDEERAQQALDTCLFLVRALLETDFPSDAKALGRQCRELVPRGDPSPSMHPAFVLDILKRVDTFRAAQATSVHIDSKPAGCAARINGLPVGETPVVVGELLPAQYRVQVECDPERRGRVHFANATSGAAKVFVDSRFDRAVETEPLLHLRYASAEAEQQHRAGDIDEIAKTVPAGKVLLMSMPTPSTLALELLGGAPLQRTAFARIATGALGPSRGDIALAARALVAGTCTDFTAVQPKSLRCEDLGVATPSEEAPRAARVPRGRFIAGLTLAGVGSAGLIAGYVLLAPRARAAEDWVAQLDSGAQPDGVAQQRWLNQGTAITITSSISAAALVTAMPLALPKRAKTPWWAWLSGGVGVGLAAFSVAYGVTADAKPDTSCSTLRITSPEAQACVRHGEQVSVAILAGATAAPLLTIPLVYLFRRDEMRLTPGVEVSRSGGYVSIGGQF